MEGQLYAQAEPNETNAVAQQSIVDSFEFLEDWNDRYQYLIQLGRQLQPFTGANKIEENRIHGCQSGVWLTCDPINGNLNFAATSDSAIVAGIIALLFQVYSGRRPQQILTTSPTFIDEIGLTQHLSPHRSNGLALMLERIHSFATAHVSEGFAEDVSS